MTESLPPEPPPPPEDAGAAPQQTYVPPPPPPPSDYPLQYDVEYPDRSLNRWTTFFRIFMVIPIAIVASFLTSGAVSYYLFPAVLLMVLFVKKYPRWWFDWNVEVLRFTQRITVYLMLMDDRYPSTDDHQSVRLDLQYPNAQTDLMRGMPLIKWLLAIPHYIVLVFLWIGAEIAVFFAWFAILFTGRYPRGLFDFVLGVQRWTLRVAAYALLLTTDKYPPFSLKP